MIGRADITAIARAALMRVSPHAHAAMRRAYWTTAPATHRDMTPENFDFYAAQLRRLARMTTRDRVLDFACGGGEIGERWIRAGLNVEFCDPIGKFVTGLQAKGRRAWFPHELPQSHYTIVICNNASSLVHPRHLRLHLEFLSRLVVPGGTLLLTDEPTLQRRHRIKSDPVFSIVRRMGVFDPNLGSIFIDEQRVKKFWPGVMVLPSWCDYRAHFIGAPIDSK